MRHSVPEQNEVVQAPGKCPQCGGRQLTTTSKRVDRNSYWRCLSCGEVWNSNRHEPGQRFGFRR
jgi:transposase-like protein